MNDQENRKANPFNENNVGLSLIVFLSKTHGQLESIVRWCDFYSKDSGDDLTALYAEFKRNVNVVQHCIKSISSTKTYTYPELMKSFARPLIKFAISGHRICIMAWEFDRKHTIEPIIRQCYDNLRMIEHRRFVIK